MIATERPAATVTAARARRRTLIRSVLSTAVFIAPASVVRIAGLNPDPGAAFLIFWAAVVAARFTLTMAAEAA